MKAAKEIRNWVNRMRRRLGKKNGVVGQCAFDNPVMEGKHARNKRRVKRGKVSLST